MHTLYYYLQSSLDKNTNRTLNFSQFIIFLKEFLTFVLIKGTKFTTKGSNLSDIDVENS